MERNQHRMNKEGAIAEGRGTHAIIGVLHSHGDPKPITNNNAYVQNLSDLRKSLCSLARKKRVSWKECGPFSYRGTPRFRKNSLPIIYLKSNDIVKLSVPTFP